jgi:hypothetical protein
MAETETHLCSELIQLTTGGIRRIANLDAIGPEGCTIFASEPLPVGTRVRMQCLECPAGIRNCASCLIRGKVLAERTAIPLGVELDVRFDELPWSPERWKPRHLIQVQGTIAAPIPQVEAARNRSRLQKPRPAV